MPNPEYRYINVHLIQKIQGGLPFDVYVERTQGAFTKLFPQGERADEERVKNYIRKGITNFSVLETDYQNYLRFVEDMANKAFQKDSKAPLKDVTGMLGEMIKASALDLFVDSNISEGVTNTAQSIVGGCIKTLSMDAAGFMKLFAMLNRHPKSVRHGMSVSVLSLVVAEAMGMSGDKPLRIVGLGGLLHDIGMSQIEADTEEPYDATPDQWKQIKAHPEIGKRLVEHFSGISTEVRQVILQHHEQPNGSGYPNRLNEAQIYPPAKIVAVADGFVNRVSPSSTDIKGIGAAEAVARMKEDIGKYDRICLRSLGELFVRTS